MSTRRAPGGRKADAIPEAHLYTDGACSGNPGPGGWAAILVDPRTRRRLEITGSEPSTTNNRMEMTAVIEGLARLKKRTRVHVFTDSRYVVQGMTSWVHGWRRNGWKTSGKKPVKNQDLWEELLLLASDHEVTFKWVEGHAGHPENERADALAVDAYQAYLR